jgi:esterase/lipase superfamily enzyme
MILVSKISIASLAVACLNLVACAPKHYTLMPTPVLYTASDLDPFAHLHPAQKTPATQVFYATTRIPKTDDTGIHYGNAYGSSLHLGTANVFLADPDASWEKIKEITLTNGENAEIPLTLGEVEKSGEIGSDLGSASDTARVFANQINAQLATAEDKEIMIYVHGTKVDFTNAAILTAEVDHFAGRDFVGVAFAWPSHQNILSYLDRVDVYRARHSSDALKRLILFLSQNTHAKKINIISYSAGGRVTSKALDELRQESSSLGSAALRKKHRIGTVVFAAADVELDIFLDRAKSISQISDHVIITMSDADNALIAGERFMGGGGRAGQEKSLQAEEDFIREKHLSNIEFIDVSAGKDQRGFDIIGHHYWYRHPWMSSDIILSMRTGLTAGQRGLSPTEMKGVWYFSPDYPGKVSAAAKKHLSGQW